MCVLIVLKNRFTDSFLSSGMRLSQASGCRCVMRYYSTLRSSIDSFFQASAIRGLIFYFLSSVFCSWLFFLWVGWRMHLRCIELWRLKLCWAINLISKPILPPHSIISEPHQVVKSKSWFVFGLRHLDGPCFLLNVWPKLFVKTMSKMWFYFW